MASDASQKMLTTVTPVKSIVKSNDPTTKIHIDTLLKAIKENRKVQFQYTYIDTEMKSW
mgnify:CR=1 FL=1